MLIERWEKVVANDAQYFKSAVICDPQIIKIMRLIQTYEFYHCIGYQHTSLFNYKFIY